MSKLKENVDLAFEIMSFLNDIALKLMYLDIPCDVDIEIATVDGLANIGYVKIVPKDAEVVDNVYNTLKNIRKGSDAIIPFFVNHGTCIKAQAVSKSVDKRDVNGELTYKTVMGDSNNPNTVSKYINDLAAYYIRLYMFILKYNIEGDMLPSSTIESLKIKTTSVDRYIATQNLLPNMTMFGSTITYRFVA